MSAKKRPRADAPPILSKLIIAAFFGFIIGLVAGLLGVGGGEFRLPVLISLLGLSVATAAAANLVVGILTVTVSLVKRLMMGIFDFATIGLITAMSVGSIFGAYAGAAITSRVSERRLKYAVGALLIILGLKMIHGALVHESPSGQILSFPFDLLLSAVLGGLIGVVCGALGVAGGELRIPALIYLFNQSTKIAGTTSLAISLPTVSAGAFKHRRMGHMNRNVLYVCLAMGIPSVVGAYVGVLLVPGASEFFLKILLGVVLILATVRVLKP